MKTLLYGTTNAGKLQVMERILKPLGISLLGLKDLNREIPQVEESGATPLENARRKAGAYYEAFQMPVFSCDTGLYLEGIPEEYQPGIHVRRPLGYEMTDQEMTEYYAGLAKRFGDIRARYCNSICFYKSGTEIYESDAKGLSGAPFLLTAEPHPKSQEGFPLDRLSVQISSGKYYYDLPDYAWDEIAVDQEFTAFFRRYLQGAASEAE